MAKQEFSVLKLADSIQTEADAYRFLEELRWENGQPEACPLCGAVGRFYFLAPKDGTTGRKTRTGANTQRRVWKCATCRKQFSVLTNTVFQGTKVPIRKWVLVMFDLCASKNSISAWEVSRRYEVTNETAWHMLHRLREAMKMEPVAGLLSGTVASDETWIGGNPRNFSKAKRAERPKGWDAFTRTTDKPAAIALVDTQSGEVRARAIPDVTGATLRKVLSEQVDLPNTTLVTDEWKGYKPLATELAAHETVNHSRDEYRNAQGYTTNRAEGFFGQLKRSIDGTHHYVSREHLDRYLTQFAWLYTNCERTDSERMRLLMANVDGRRLPYYPTAR